MVRRITLIYIGIQHTHTYLSHSASSALPLQRDLDRLSAAGGSADTSNLVDIVFAWEDRLAVQKLGQNTAGTPHVNRLIVASS